MLTVPGPPEQIKALAMTSDSIMVAWTRPLEPNGNIIKYNVYYHSLLHKVSFRKKFLNKQSGYLHEAYNFSASQKFP
jgi:Fibronectin type III domain.